MSLFGLSLGFNITVLVLVIKGLLVTRPQLDQVQKTADTFQAAWATAQADNSEQKLMIVEIADGMKTVTKFIRALPPSQDRDNL
jgi:uncharacterized membrane protein (DUF106 family)